MQGVGAALHDDVDSAATCMPVRGVGFESVDTDLIDRIDGRIVGNPKIAGSVGGAVYEQLIRLRGRAPHGENGWPGVFEWPTEAGVAIRNHSHRKLSQNERRSAVPGH